MCIVRISLKCQTVVAVEVVCVCAIDCVIIDNDRIDVYSVILQWRTRAQ